MKNSSEMNGDIVVSTHDEFMSTAEHFVLTVEQDDGVFRCIHVGRPGCSVYSFRIVTWPGSLAISGDVDGYAFSRLYDMFDFFTSPNGQIKTQYWHQKLTMHDKYAPPTEFNINAFVGDVSELVCDLYEADESDGVYEKVYAAVELTVKESLMYGLEDVHDFIYMWDGSDNNFGVQLNQHCADVHNCGTVWNRSFIWALHAIVWTVKQYTALKGEQQ